MGGNSGYRYIAVLLCRFLIASWVFDCYVGFWLFLMFLIVMVTLGFLATATFGLLCWFVMLVYLIGFTSSWIINFVLVVCFGGSDLSPLFGLLVLGL